CIPASPGNSSGSTGRVTRSSRPPSWLPGSTSSPSSRSGRSTLACRWWWTRPPAPASGRPWLSLPIMSSRGSVFVEAGARLHFGVLDLRGTLGRRFGGLGAAVPTPSVLLEAAPATEVRADGPDRDRAEEF